MKNLIIGQRYMSVAEPELGLGLVVKIEDKTLVVSYPACGEQRRYGKKTAPLKRILFEIGDEVVSNNQVKFIVSQTIEDDDGLIIYVGQDINQAFKECDLLDSINFHRPEEKLLNLGTDSQELFNLRYQTIKLKTWLSSNPYYGLIGARIGLIHHQLYLVNEIVKRIHPRVLLADEVGLGKTIEAGLIIHKLLITNRIERVLIVLPNALCFQWFLEMYRKYNLSFTVISESDTLNNQTNPFDENNFVITSIQLINSSEKVKQNILDAKFDLLVVDEAHRMEYSEGNPSETYRNIEQLGSHIKGLLLLTATPEMFGLEGHFARLKLIDPDHFFDYQKFIKDHDVLNDMALVGKKLVEKVPLDAADRAILDKIGIEETNDDEILNSLIDRHGTGRIYFRNTRAVMCKTYNFFPERFLHPIPLGESSDEEINYVNYAPDEHFTSSSYQLRLIWLIEFLKSNPKEKILLICQSKEKVLQIEKDLLRSYGPAKIALFHSDLSLLARDRQAAYFSDPEGAPILLCSEIGSEGRNFEFSNQLVLFDLPSTPDLLEQRIGRLDRIGQNRDIHIHVPYLKNSWEEILFRFYHDSLNAFKKTMNGGMKVLDLFQEELNASFSNVEALLKDNNSELNKLLLRCQESYLKISQDLESGRDILIELNSFRKDDAQEIVDAIKRIDESDELQKYLESVFNNFGVDLEELGDDCYYIKPGDNMYVPSFPNLPAAGFTYTCSRQKALEKEEITFMTWDHPLVQGVMELIMGGEFGNATVTTRAKAGKPKPFIEIFFLISSVAPKALEIERFLPPQTLRVLINLEADDFSEKFAKEKLDSALVDASKEIRMIVTKIGKERLKTLLKKASSIAEVKFENIILDAKKQVNLKLNFEADRLEYLQRVNPLDSTSDIVKLKSKQADLLAYIDRAEMNLDSLRFIY